MQLSGTFGVSTQQSSYWRSRGAIMSLPTVTQGGDARVFIGKHFLTQKVNSFLTFQIPFLLSLTRNGIGRKPGNKSEMHDDVSTPPFLHFSEIC